MKLGRPTKLTLEVMEKAKQYVDGGYLVDELVPTIAGLSLFIDIRRSTIYEWAKDNQEFSDIVDKVMGSQEKGLLKGALGGDYNATIAKLMLTKHGYTDKVEQDLKSTDGTMSPTKIEIVAPSVHNEG